MENKKKNIIDWIIKLVLIIIIIILLLHNCSLVKKKNKERETTGNVDIIEIICDKDNSCKHDDKKNDATNNNNNVNENPSTGNRNDTKPVIADNTTEEPSEEPEPDDLFVKDNEIIWHGTAPAKIFTNSMYEFKEIIAPESSNTYQFVVKNGTEYNLKYNISFNESNQYNINMKYKLKKNDTYIIDHYVSASELNVSEMLLDSKKNDTYYLEWKWISSDNDTAIGKTRDAKYSLKIDIKAESIND